ncbi:3',5'-cyclic-nucleotide phosphodiesterase [Methylobacillus flagellatus]|uniref:Beta-lactamase-like protein n=1 Tax=Methylobacillus flagellatus (strain ATCC 51484 / DSM 6875 / VKM B-1610 / KT) TaxID=265072 RepID=Q1GZE2_METFK|nr:3',5'-cyclic-nucleotide phosphodiesterase [Methylobacillus flagellatus]ABE50395.1 beta-lactamase-like protein [Methylobacillus flagellatus KT]
MNVQVLGCSGGIGQGLRTTSLLVDGDILIDAGTGVGDLTLAQMSTISHVFLTHAHLDHIAFLPLLLDAVLGKREQPVTVHALPETIASLKAHIFNGHIWPDFNQIPTPEQPLLQYAPITVGDEAEIAGRRIVALPANHSVPAVGYLLGSGSGSLAFTGDTTSCDEFWQVLNQAGNLRHLIIEVSFTDAEIALALVSHHYCPALLLNGLDRLKPRPEVWVTHLKPGEGEAIMQEIDAARHPLVPKALQHGQVLNV